MYQLLRRSSERPWADPAIWLEAADDSVRSRKDPLILRMQENRSRLPQHARSAVAVLAVLFMATTLLAAWRGFWLIPAFSLSALAALTFALDHHRKSRPRSETLELGDGRVRHRDAAGRTVEYPAFWMRLAAEAANPSDLRLFLRSREGSIEFGNCLSLDERRQVAALVAAALADTKGGG